MPEPIWFPDKPIVQPLAAHRWRLYRGYVVPVDMPPFKTNMLIPEGFVTDFASVPHVLHGLIGADDCGSAAPIAHDWLYQNGGCFNYTIEKRSLTRRQADRLFRKLMRLEKVPAWRRHVAWLAVRLAGWACWRKGKKGERHV